MSDELIEFWKKFRSSEYPFVHPSDKNLLEKVEFAPRRDSFSMYAQAKDFVPPDTKLRMELLPVPYSGDLRNADIFILLLNPGFDHLDFYAETYCQQFRDRLTKTLVQDFSDTEFRFMWLDPELCWTGGFRWWERKLRGVARKLAEKEFGGRYREALKYLSTRIASVELFPYHSGSFGNGAVLKKLPSAAAARNFTHKTLLPAAERSDLTVIVTRAKQQWGARASKNGLVVYEGGQTRGASLGPYTRSLSL